MSCSCSLSQTGNSGMTYLGVVHIKGDVYSLHHGVQFSNPVSVIHQTSQKCCVFLYLDFTARLPNHLLNATVVHFLHLLVWKDQSPSEVWVHSQVSWDVEFCELDVIASIPPHYPYHVCCRNHIQNACKHILFWILSTPPHSNTKQHIHTDRHWTKQCSNRNPFMLQHCQLAALAYDSQLVKTVSTLLHFMLQLTHWTHSLSLAMMLWNTLDFKNLLLIVTRTGLQGIYMCVEYESEIKDEL
jgi:hypothetical protein